MSQSVPLPDIYTWDKEDSPLWDGLSDVEGTKNSEAAGWPFSAIWTEQKGKPGQEELTSMQDERHRGSAFTFLDPGPIHTSRVSLTWVPQDTPSSLQFSVFHLSLF